ncbi:hypothetical protein ACHAWC_009968 [Mediolabrus comicus]
MSLDENINENQQRNQLGRHQCFAKKSISYSEDSDDDNVPINKLPSKQSRDAPKGRDAQKAEASTKKSKDESSSKGKLKDDDEYHDPVNEDNAPKEKKPKDQKKDDVGGGGELVPVKNGTFIYDESKEYGATAEIGMKLPCCVKGCPNQRTRLFYDVQPSDDVQQSEKSIITRDFCARHFRNHYDSLSAAQQVEHDNAKQQLMQELNAKIVRMNLSKDQMLSGKLRFLCMDANLSIARFVPKSRGEGMALLDYRAVADIVGVPPEDMYKRLTRDYDAKPDKKMLHPKKPGTKRRRLPGAFDRPVVLYLKGFNATDPPPGLSREYLDNKNKKARERRAEKTAAKKRKMDNEYDSDDDSD